MYPQRELRRLALHKALLRQKIGRDRATCLAAAAHVAQPLDWLDRALAFWRRIAPVATIAAVPLGFLLQRTVFPRLKMLRSLLKWGPLAFGAMRSVSAAFKTRA